MIIYNRKQNKDKPFGTRWCLGRAFFMPFYGDETEVPWKPKKPCKYPNCSELTDGIYCENHRKQMSREYEKFSRDPVARKRYGWSWRKIRARFLHGHPLCEMCMREGRATKATEVHHIKPLGHGGTNADENLMALCKPCHSRITAEMGDRWHDR